MTRSVLTLQASASLGEAIGLMLDRRISGLPVVDAQGCLVGMLTEGDLLRRVELGTHVDHEACSRAPAARQTMSAADLRA